MAEAARAGAGRDRADRRADGDPARDGGRPAGAHRRAARGLAQGRRRAPARPNSPRCYARLHDALVEHLDAEEQHVMPLVEECITAEGVGARSARPRSAARRSRTARACSACSPTTATPRSCARCWARCPHRCAARPEGGPPRVRQARLARVRHADAVAGRQPNQRTRRTSTGRYLPFSSSVSAIPGGIAEMLGEFVRQHDLACSGRRVDVDPRSATC